MGKFFLVFSLGLILGASIFFVPKQSFFQKISESITEVVPSPSPEITPLLPDLQILPPKELLITRPAAGKKILRFDTVTMNLGQGPFEVIGHTDAAQQKTFASQYIKLSDGTGKYTEVGAFVYHPEHQHWHIENYVEYQLWSIKADNEPDQRLANSEKISSCLWDIRASDTNLTNAPKTRVYTSACNRTAQGISVGWSDIYNARFEGQEMDIGAVPDGTFLLKFVVNPDNVFKEQNLANNSGMVRIEIAGNRVRLIE